MTITSRVRVNTTDYDKDSGVLTPGPTITSGHLTGMSVSSTSHVAGETAVYTFGFIPAHNVAPGGYFYIVDRKSVV